MLGLQHPVCSISMGHFRFAPFYSEHFSVHFLRNFNDNPLAYNLQFLFTDILFNYIMIRRELLNSLKCKGEYQWKRKSHH